MERVHCLNKTACPAKEPGKLCISCSAKSPEVRAKRSASIRRRFAEDPELLQRRIESAIRLTRDPAIIEKRRATARITWSDPELRARHAAACAATVARKMQDPAFVEKLREAGRRVGTMNLDRGANSEIRQRAGRAIRAHHLAWCPPQYWDLNAKLKASGFLLDERKALILAQAEHDSPEATALREARALIHRITEGMEAKAAHEKAMAY